MLSRGLAQYLHNAGFVVFKESGLGATVVLEYLPPNPSLVTLLRTYGGSQPDAWLGYDIIFVQVLCRGENQDPRPVYTRIQQLYNALQGLQTTLPDGTGLINCVAIQQPYSLGLDENIRHMYVFNLRCEVRNQTTLRE